MVLNMYTGMTEFSNKNMKMKARNNKLKQWLKHIKKNITQRIIGKIIQLKQQAEQFKYDKIKPWLLCID